MKKMIIISASLALLVCAVVWYFLIYEDSETTQAKRGRVIQAVYATGEVEPVHWSKMATQIAGKVETVLVKEGDRLSVGQKLLKLDDMVERSKIMEYQARLQFLEKEKKRYQALSRSDFSSKSKYERIVSEYKAAKAKLDTQKEIVRRMTITSPLEGVVLKRDVEPGETITITDIIFWVGKLTSLRITGEVDEEDISLVKVGQKALIKADAFPTSSIEGTVSDITPKGDPIDKNFRVHIALPRHTPLLIGMTVEINIIAQTIENALIVPASSVIDGKVWVKTGAKFKERGVKLGVTNEKEAQILDGLSESDVIILTPTASQKQGR